MNPIFINPKGLSYLRFLTNRLIDEEVAEVLLENADLEKILDIQAVMIIGMEAIEQGKDAPFDNPETVYSRCRQKLPAFEDREEEIQYLLQPHYKQYLQAGMRVLTIY